MFNKLFTYAEEGDDGVDEDTIDFDENNLDNLTDGLI
jgi:hypothetical protein